jgi:hypothetical protein
MPPFLLSLLEALLGFFFPAAPAWLLPMLDAALPGTVEIVHALEDRDDLSGPARARLAIEEVGALLDEALDDVPEWRAISEARRDRIIGGLVELALFVERVSSRPGGRASARDAVWRIREGARPVPGQAPRPA